MKENMSIQGHGEKLSRKQEQAIIALITKPTIGEAAKEVGVSEATLWRWLQIPSFSEAYNDVKRKIVKQAVTRLQQISGEAVETLRDVMTDKESPASSRVTAAKSILEMTLKAAEMEDVVQRIEELEKQLEKGA